MEPGSSHTFDSFRLEPPPGGLWRGDVRLALRLRPLAMLRYLDAPRARSDHIGVPMWSGEQNSFVCPTFLR